MSEWVDEHGNTTDEFSKDLIYAMRCDMLRIAGEPYPHILSKWATCVCLASGGLVRGYKPAESIYREIMAMDALFGWVDRQRHKRGTMTPLKIITDPERVAEYLEEHSLLWGNVLLEAVLLQHGGTDGGLPAVLLIGTVDGKKRVIKTTLRLFMTATEAMSAVAETTLGPDWRGP